MEPAEPLTSNYPLFNDYLRACQKEHPNLEKIEKKYKELETSSRVAQYNHSVIASDFFISQKFVDFVEKHSNKFYKHKESVSVKKKHLEKLLIDALVLHYTVWGFTVTSDDKTLVISLKK